MKKRPLVPWVVGSGDFRRYLGRAIDAASAGRAIYVFRGKGEEPVAVLLGVERYRKCCASACEYWRGRSRFVRLSEIRRRRR